MARIAPPRANEPEDDEAVDARKDRGSADAEDPGSRLGRLGPAAPVEVGARTVPECVEAIELQAPLTAVVHRPVAQRNGDLVLPRADRCADGMGEDPSGGLDEALLLREFDALLDRLPSPLHEPFVSQNRECADGTLQVAELHGEVESTRDRPHRPRVHPGLCELTTRRQRLEERNCFLSGPLRLRRSAGTPQDVGQPAERLSLLLPLTERAPKPQLLLSGFDRLVYVVGQVALDRPQMEQIRAPRRREICSEPECARILRGGLAVGTERRGAGGRGGRVADDCVGVAGGVGVMGEPRQVRRAGRRIVPAPRAPPGGAPASDRGATESSTARRASSCRNSMPTAFDRSMPEVEAVVEAVQRLSGDRLEQPELGLRRDDRDRLEDSLRRKGRGGPPARALRRGPYRGSPRRRRRAPRRRRTGFPAVLS